MPEIIVDGAVVTDDWTVLPRDFDSATPLPDGRLLVPLEAWNLRAGEISARDGETGLWIDSDQLPDEIGGDLHQAPVIAVHFPEFRDGRGFSIGRLLRERLGYRGQLRAFGKPIRDQLHYLRRCGFNAFALAEHYDPHTAIESLNAFDESYQAAVDQPLPLFRRR